jgi:hypothetical protein
MRAPTDASLDDDWATKFSGKLYVVLLDRKLEPSIRGGRSLWALSQPLCFRSDIGPATITVPPGFVTDLTSIPRLVWILLPPDGPWVKPAIIHDFLYATEGDGKAWDRDTSIDPGRVYTRAEADAVLLEAMVNRHIHWLPRTIIYLAVRIGGWLGWGRGRRRRRVISKTGSLPPAEGAVKSYIDPV